MVKDDTLAAGVAEVSLDRTTGKIKVHNFWAAIDAGIAVQPRNLAAQTEGSIVYGARPCAAREDRPSRTGTCCSRTTPTTRSRACRTCPTSRSRWSRPTTRRPAAARTACRWSPCAVGNAIAALTGVRLRELPFSPDRVRGSTRSLAIWPRLPVRRRCYWIAVAEATAAFSRATSGFQPGNVVEQPRRRQAQEIETERRVLVIELSTCS